jgi:predicted secreted Zn-dependent protease
MPDELTYCVDRVEAWSAGNAPKGFRYLAAHATFSGLDPRGITVSFRDFQIRGSDGSVFSPTPYGKQPSLPERGTLEVGKQLTGFVTFLVALAGSYVLSYQPEVATSGGSVVTAVSTVSPATADPATADPTTDAGLVALTLLSAPVPGATSIHYFEISGSNPNSLMADDTAKGSALCQGDADACVAPDWAKFEVSLGYVGRVCTVVVGSILPSYTVYMPRWSSPGRVPPQLLVWWRAVLDHIAWHEGHHITIENGLIPALRQKLSAASCSTAQSIEDAWRQQLNAAQDAFDAQDRATYSPPPYDGPWAP